MNNICNKKLVEEIKCWADSPHNFITRSKAIISLCDSWLDLYEVAKAAIKLDEKAYETLDYLQATGDYQVVLEHLDVRNEFKVSLAKVRGILEEK